MRKVALADRGGLELPANSRRDTTKNFYDVVRSQNVNTDHHMSTGEFLARQKTPNQPLAGNFWIARLLEAALLVSGLTDRD